MPMIPTATLIVVADGRAARLFRNKGDESRVRLHQDMSFDSDDARESSPSGSQPQDNDVGEAAFAKMLAERINRAALKHRFEHLVLVADPTTLGEIRPQLHKETNGRMLAEVSKDWTNMPVEKIEHALTELRIG